MCFYVWVNSVDVVDGDVFCVVTDLSELPTVEIEPLPPAVLQSFSAQFEKSESRAPVPPEADLSHVDPQLTRSLMPFQRDGVKCVSSTGVLMFDG